MRRDDYDTLVSLGLSDDDMSGLGLLEPAEGPPEDLVDIYLRRSKKSEDIATLRGHLRDIMRWVQRENLKVRHVWFEQLSASKTYVRRYEFEKCTDAVLEGKSKTMAAWKTDRFDRRGMGQVGLLLDRLEQRRARLVCTTENLDSSQQGSRMIFGFMSEKARGEAKDIALRVTIGHREHKELNRRGTGHPPYGLYSPRLPDGKASGIVEPHPEEFPIARRIADLLLGTAGNLPEKWRHLEGSPLSTQQAAYIMNAEGHRTRRGYAWASSNIAKLAHSPQWAGMVPAHERRVDEHGNPLGTWKTYGNPLLDLKGQPRMCGVGVVTVAEWYRIQALMRTRTQADSGGGSRGKPGPKYVGTGIYHCGRIRPHEDHKGALAPCLGYLSHRGGRYSCDIRQKSGADICQGIHATAAPVDFAVGRAWVNHVSALEPKDPVLRTIGRRWLALSDPAQQERKEHARDALAAAEKRVKKLEDDYYVYGKLSESRYEELAEAQRATITAMSATLEVLDEETDLSPLLNAEELGDSWERATLADRRMLLMCALGGRGVIIAPAKGQGDRSPIEDRLEFDWISA